MIGEMVKEPQGKGQRYKEAINWDFQYNQPDSCSLLPYTFL